MIKALHNYITIEVIDEPAGKFIIEKDLSPKARVTSVGSKVRDIKPGDVIYYRARSGHEYNGQHFIKAEEILAIEEV